MPDISYYKHFLRAVISMSLGKYDITLDAFIKMIKHNLSPKNRIINYDNWIKYVTEKIIKEKNLQFQNIDVSNLPKKNCIICTELYDTGGHTELVVRDLQQHGKEYPIFVYLTNSFLREKEKMEQIEKSKIIKELAQDYYISDKNISMTDKVFELYNYIVDNKITNAVCMFHMQDAVSCAVLYLIKKYTNIEIDFCNHGDHHYSLGTTFADKIYTRVKNGHALTPYLKNNTKVVYGTFVLDGNINHYDNELFIQKREELGIPKDAFITLTGCSLHKLCPDHFKMIHTMLEQNKNIHHIFICTMDEKKKQKLKKKYKLDKRFIIIDYVPNFDFYIQLSDLYVDSFPQGGALTLVDYIKHSKPVIIKINKKEAIRSFEEYLYPNYEFAFDTSKGMLEGITKIANDKELYKQMQEKVHEHFLKTYLG